MIKKLIMSSAIVMMVAACNKNIEEPLQYGTISVKLSDEPVIEVVTKADALDKTSNEAKNYTLRIFDASAQEMYEATYFDFQPKTLPLGTYYVTAENCTEAEAEEGNGKMRLADRSSNIVLTSESLSQTATLNCTVTNAMVTVKFDESVQGRFENLQVVLQGGTTVGRTLTIPQTAVGVATQTWFNPSDLVYTITGKFKSGGIEKDVNISNSSAPIALSAKSNVELLVKVSLGSGQITYPSVTVDTQINSITTENVEYNPYL